MSNNKIFIGIPSWRDPFVKQTIISAVTKARFPENIVLGVVFQGYPGEDNWMIDDIHTVVPNEIRLINLDANSVSIFLTDIKGDMLTSLVQDEEYYMQVDSHTRFVDDWDIRVIAELNIANRIFGKSILTNQTDYFVNWIGPMSNQSLTAIPDEKHFYQMKQWSFADCPLSANGLMVNKPQNTMIKEKFYSGNSWFAHAQFIKDVPQPKGYTITYEQQIMAARVFTGGYSIVSATQPYTESFSYHGNGEFSNGDIYIRHVRKLDPRWQDKFIKADAESRKLYHEVITKKIVSVQGLLSERSYAEYVDFIGYDPHTMILTRPAKILDRDYWKIVDDQEINKEIVKILTCT